jgi:hypothetical protein
MAVATLVALVEVAAAAAALEIARRAAVNQRARPAAQYSFLACAQLSGSPDR